MMDLNLSRELILPIFGIAVGLFFTILFLQSGMDKIVDRKGNLEWLIGHFEGSPLGGNVPILLSILTLTEILAGLICLVGAVIMGVGGEGGILAIGIIVCLANFLMLFFGQRMAKDYAGAAGIVPYFLVGIFSLLVIAAL